MDNWPELPSPRRSESRKSSYESPQARHKKLREMLDRTNMLQENATVGSLDVLQQTVQEVENIHLDIDDKIVNQDQILLDSQVMKSSSHVIRGAMQSLDQGTNPYNAAEYAQNIIKYVCNLADETVQEPNWELLTREVTAFVKPCGASLSFLHCMAPIPKNEADQKKPRVANRTKDAFMPAKQPETITSIADDDDPVDKSVEKIAQLIKKHYKRTKKPVNVLRLIINPHAFGKTIENMLHVSFLIRDGRMALTVGEGDELLIEPVPKAVQEEQEASGNVNRIANIPTITMEMWRQLVEVLNIEEPMINPE